MQQFNVFWFAMLSGLLFKFMTDAFKWFIQPPFMHSTASPYNQVFSYRGFHILLGWFFVFFVVHIGYIYLQAKRNERSAVNGYKHTA